MKEKIIKILKEAWILISIISVMWLLTVLLWIIGFMLYPSAESIEAFFKAIGITIITYASSYMLYDYIKNYIK